MQLSELGLDPWFLEQAGELSMPGGLQLARVIVVDRGWYIVRNEAGEAAARTTGKFLHTTQSTSDMPCVGDWVCVHYEADKSATIHSLLPRKSFLRRKSAGKDIQLQMIAANIDVAFIVQGCQYDFNVARLERYLVMAAEGHVEPVLVLTKTDLVSEEALAHLLAEIRAGGIKARIMALSNVSGQGLEQLKGFMAPGKTYCLLGSSGVGKSTLINKLTGQDTLKTGLVSASGEGRHTTVRRQLIVLEQGALIIDTPGMREIGIFVASQGMADSFADIEELARRCRFSNCRHSNEPGCALLQAIKEGNLSPERYDTYQKLNKESAFNVASHGEKQRKEKTGGKAASGAGKKKGKRR